MTSEANNKSTRFLLVLTRKQIQNLYRSASILLP